MDVYRAAQQREQAQSLIRRQSVRDVDHGIERGLAISDDSRWSGVREAGEDGLVAAQSARARLLLAPPKPSAGSFSNSISVQISVGVSGESFLRGNAVLYCAFGPPAPTRRPWRLRLRARSEAP